MGSQGEARRAGKQREESREQSRAESREQRAEQSREQLVQRVCEREGQRGERGENSELERRVEGRGLEFRQYRTSASVGWNKDRVLPEGWMLTRVGLYLLLELSLQVGWSKDRVLSEGWMLTRFLPVSATGAEFPDGLE